MIIPTVNGAFTKEGHHFHFPQKYRFEARFGTTNLLFSKRMEKLGYLLDEQAELTISWNFSASVGEEGYIAEIDPSEIKIFSQGEKGYQYALNSLYQNIVTKKGFMRPMILEDKPRFAYRGLLVDCCRHFFSIKELTKIVDQCSLLKINHLHLHLSDDQGYRIESKKYPLLNKIGSYRCLSSIDPLVTSGRAKKGDVYGGYYKQSELVELVKHAKERNVTIVPDIEMPGHCSAILASYSEFSCSGTTVPVRNQFGIFNKVFCPGKEKTYAFIESLLDEIMTIFPSKYIHLGGDECPHQAWDCCPDCQALKEKENWNDDELQSHFISKISNYLTSKGRKSIAWNESFRSGTTKENVICQYWNEMNQEKSEVIKETANGRKFILSNMNAFYFDYPYSDTPLRATLKYHPTMKKKSIPEQNVMGVEGAIWTEWIADEQTLEHQIYPRLLALSEIGWNKKIDVSAFIKKCQTYLSFKELQVLEPMPWEKVEYAKQDAVRMIFGNMKSLGARYRMDPAEMDPDNVTFSHSANQNADPIAELRSFFEEKMQFGYTKKDVDKVMDILLGRESK